MGGFDDRSSPSLSLTSRSICLLPFNTTCLPTPPVIATQPFFPALHQTCLAQQSQLRRDVEDGLDERVQGLGEGEMGLDRGM